MCSDADAVYARPHAGADHCMRPMDHLAQHRACRAKQGPLIVARDIAHAKISERFDQTGVLPEYVKAMDHIGLSCQGPAFLLAQDHPIYYAGPAKQNA